MFTFLMAEISLQIKKIFSVSSIEKTTKLKVKIMTTAVLTYSQFVLTTRKKDKKKKERSNVTCPETSISYRTPRMFFLKQLFLDLCEVCSHNNHSPNYIFQGCMLTSLAITFVLELYARTKF